MHRRRRMKRLVSHPRGHLLDHAAGTVNRPDKFNEEDHT
jgi:hypothetical protein